MGKRTANFFAMKGHRVKILLDIVVTILLLLAMAHSLIGEMSHEWMGIGVLLLLLLHLILNGKWLGTMFKGRYTAYRIFQSSLVLLLAITMLGSMVSGVVLSKYLFGFFANGANFFIRTSISAVGVANCSSGKPNLLFKCTDRTVAACLSCHPFAN